MRELNSITEIEECIKDGAKLLYVSSPKCNVCKDLKPKIKDLIDKKFPKIEIFEADVSKIPQIAAKFNIFSAPAILVFFDGQEFVREGRNISLELFSARIAKIYDVYFG